MELEQQQERLLQRQQEPLVVLEERQVGTETWDNRNRAILFSSEIESHIRCLKFCGIEKEDAEDEVFLPTHKISLTKISKKECW